MKVNFEILFSNALCGLIENNGGSIEEALDYLGVDEDMDRAVIKDWYGWDCDGNLPEECIIDFSDMENIEYEYGANMEEAIATNLVTDFNCGVKKFDYILFEKGNSKYITDGQFAYVFNIEWESED